MKLLNKIKYALNQSKSVNGLVVIKKGQKYGVVDKNGDVVFDFVKNDLFLSGHYVIVEKEYVHRNNPDYEPDLSKYSIVDLRTSKPIFENVLLKQVLRQNTTIDKQKTEILVVTDEKNNSGLFCLSTGKTILNLTEAKLLENGNFLIKRDGKYGVVSENLDKIIPCEYDKISFDGKNFITQTKEDPSLTPKEIKALDVKQEESNEEINSPKQQYNHELS